MSSLKAHTMERIVTGKREGEGGRGREREEGGGGRGAQPGSGVRRPNRSKQADTRSYIHTTFKIMENRAVCVQSESPQGRVLSLSF